MTEEQFSALEAWVTAVARAIVHDIDHYREMAEDRREEFRNLCVEQVRKCRVCGCTDDDCSGCIEKTGVPCGWAEADLCTACVPVQEGLVIGGIPVTMDQALPPGVMALVYPSGRIQRFKLTEE